VYDPDFKTHLPGWRGGAACGLPWVRNISKFPDRIDCKNCAKKLPGYLDRSIDICEWEIKMLSRSVLSQKRHLAILKEFKERIDD